MDESLSSKKLTLYRDMNGLTCPTGVFRNEDVKEFIKKVKWLCNCTNKTCWKCQRIDKLAGKELTGKPVNLGK